MTGHWGHPTIRPAIPDGLRHGVLYSLTAWNPQGQTLPKADNERRNSAMASDIAALGFPRVYRSFACCGASGAWYEAGFTLHVDGSDSEKMRVMALARQWDQLSVFRYNWDAASDTYLQVQIVASGDEAAVPCPIHVTPVSVQTHDFLYPSLESAAAVLLEYSARDGVDLGEVRTEIDTLMSARVGSPSASKTHPVVVLEGIDGSGKSTLCASLAERLHGVLLKTPPDRVLRQRKVFDACDEPTRRAYYALCNYSAAQDILEASRTQTVVVDRYWFSTVAYAIARARTLGVEVDGALSWPRDLLRPSVVLLLRISEEERLRRIVRRGEPVTQEEHALKAQSTMRDQLMRAYTELSPDAVLNADVAPGVLLAETVAEVERLCAMGL